MINIIEIPVPQPAKGELVFKVEYAGCVMSFLNKFRALSWRIRECGVIGPGLVSDALRCVESISSTPVSFATPSTRPLEFRAISQQFSYLRCN